MVQPAEQPRAAQSARTAALTRARILEAARTLFAKHGYDGTSIRMVARACGLTNPAVHYHFRTKRDLYEALLASSIRSESEVPLRDHLAIRAHMEHQFFLWVENLPFAQLLLRQQIGGDRQSMDYLRKSEADYVAQLGMALKRFHSEETAARIADLAFTVLSGAFWDALLTYGTEAESVMKDDFFKARIRRFIGAVLDAGERISE